MHYKDISSYICDITLRDIFYFMNIHFLSYPIQRKNVAI